MLHRLERLKNWQRRDAHDIERVGVEEDSLEEGFIELSDSIIYHLKKTSEEFLVIKDGRDYTDFKN